ncbi:MAG: hypothetical protein H6609_17905 [Ignavibacteriales bacterium]|nr:hypothetical protein [Ignavibacteriales bacterium]
MEFLSINNTYETISNIIDLNPSGSLVGIIGNDFCGFEYLTSLIINSIENRAYHQCVVIDSSELINLEKFSQKINSLAYSEFGEAGIFNANVSYESILLSYIDRCSKTSIKAVVLIFSNFEKLNVEQQYTLSSQFRNIREQLKVYDSSVAVHIAFMGKFSYFSLEKRCNKLGTSSVFDNLILIAKSSLEEANLIFSALYKDNLVWEKLESSFEYCNGEIDLMNSFYKYQVSHTEEKENLNNFIYNKQFIENINSSFEKLGEKHCSVLVKMLEGFEFKVHFSEFIEELYLSGFVSISKKKQQYTLKIRNWFYEIVLRKFLKDKIYHNASELLPPLSSSNKLAYSIILRIENRIKNLILTTLSKYEFVDHPLELLDVMGLIKTTESSNKNYTILGWCKHSQYKLIEVFDIKAHCALSAFLDLRDLSEILTSDIIFSKDNGKKIHEIFEGYFPQKNDLEHLLEELRRIRNPIAHNILVSENVINKLYSIEKKMFENLSLEYQ